MATEEEQKVVEPKEATPPIVPDPKVVELETLHQQLTESQTALTAEREKAKISQRDSSANANRLKREREDYTSRITTLEKKTDVTLKMMAHIVDNLGIQGEPQPQRQSMQFLEALDETKPKPATEPQYPTDFLDKAQEAEELAKSVGLDMAKSKELRAARKAFRDGDAEDGLEEVKMVVESKRQSLETKKVEPPLKGKLSEAEKEEIAREYMEEKGLLTVDTNAPSGASFLDADFLKKFGSGDIAATKANVDRYNKIKQSY